MSRSSLQRATVANPRWLAAPQAGGPAPGARRGPWAVVAAALIIAVAAAAAGAGTWYVVRKASTAPAPAPAVVTSGPASGPAASGPAGSGPTGPASAPPAGLASLAPSAALYPGADAIEKVVNRYFQAINAHDYVAYQATQSPGIAMTQPQFQAGFKSTRDSDVLITGINTMPGGQPAADMTFTSRQQPQDGPEGESCTTWRVTMYFDGSAGTYTIGAPPNGYKAAYQACAA
jgi:hypothetical protein